MFPIMTSSQTEESLGDDEDTCPEENDRLLQRGVGAYCNIGRNKLTPPRNIPPSLRRRLLWKLVLLIMALFFFSAAYVQHNDPDPYLWMPVYLLPFCLNLFLLIYLPQRWNLLNLFISLHIIYCFLLGFSTALHYYLNTHWELDLDSSILLPLPSPLSEPNMQLEEAKELLGLCLVIAWLAFLYDGKFLRCGNGGLLLGSSLTAFPIMAWVLVEKIEEEQASQCK